MQLGYIQITPLAVKSEHTFNELFLGEEAEEKVPTFRSDTSFGDGNL